MPREAEDIFVDTTKINSYKLITAPHEFFSIIKTRSPNTTFRLNYSFRWKTKIHEYMSSGCFNGTTRLPQLVNSFHLDIRGDFETNLGEELERNLPSNIPEVYRDEVIEKIVHQTKLEIKPWKSTGNTCFDFSVHVKHYVTRTQVPDDEFIEISFPEDDIYELFQSSPRVVPASDQAIESLEHKIVVLPCGLIKESCTVCLEGFPIGGKMAKMPCSHWFHEQCIKTWLKETHSCPVCRYKMPTS